MVKIAVKEIKIWNGNPNPDMKNINSYAVEFFSNKGVLGIPISLTEEYEEDWVQHMILDGISIHCETQDIQFVGNAQNKCQAEHDIVLGPTVVELCCDISITSHLSDGSDSDEEWWTFCENVKCNNWASVKNAGFENETMHWLN